MRLRNRILTVFVVVAVSGAIGLAVAGIPRSTPLDPVLGPISTTTSTTVAAPAPTVATTAPPTTNASDTEIVIEILNAGAGLRGAALVADSLDLQLAADVLLGDAPTAQDRSSILFRSAARPTVDALLIANPQLLAIDTTEIFEVNEWPEWASPSAAILIVVGANWPQS
jgi:hypothetical protein